MKAYNYFVGFQLMISFFPMKKRNEKDEYYLYMKCNLMSSVCFFLPPCPLFIERKYPSKFKYIFVTCSGHLP